MAGLMAYPATLRAQSTSSPAQPIGGTWLATVTLYPLGTLYDGVCTPAQGAPPSSQFSSFISFAEGGTVTDTTMNPAFLPGQRSPGHGSWTVLGPNTYQAASEAFVRFDSSNPPYVLRIPTNANFYAGIQKITQTITYDSADDRWTSVASVKFFKQDGTFAPQHGCATAEASRVTDNYSVVP